MSPAPVLTLMLPTRNRSAWVIRAVRSCLAQDSPAAKLRVLVIDGHSTDGSWEKLQITFAEDPRVCLRRQEKEKGFVGACREAVAALDSPYAGLIFDDDVLLPNYRHLLKTVVQGGFSYGFGFGRLGCLKEVLEVPTARGFWMMSPQQLLEGFLGLRGKLTTEGYPQSPMCGVFSSELWRIWAEEIRSFCSTSPWRTSCLIERAAGPDFLIFLIALARTRRAVPVLQGVVTQFSRHDGTLTSSLQGRDLPTGYWLSFFWLHAELLRQRKAGDAANVLVHQQKKARSLARLWDENGRKNLQDE
ncbi:glycosyltransferase family 2 protein, partial [bacterium]|nr:glycosyltransferase family 2 protein [bacterium]